MVCGRRIFFFFYCYFLLPPRPPRFSPPRLDDRFGFSVTPLLERWAAEEVPLFAAVVLFVVDGLLAALFVFGVVGLTFVLFFLFIFVGSFQTLADDHQSTKKISPLFWQLEFNGVKSYALGSIHLGNPSMYPLPAAIMSAVLPQEVVVSSSDATPVARSARTRASLPKRAAPNSACAIVRT